VPQNTAGVLDIGVEVVDVINTPENAVSSAVKGNYVYVADINGGLRIIEL